MTAPHTLPLIALASVHEHAWITESLHATSEGRVRYVRCADCPVRRVDVDPSVSTPPTAVTREIG